MSPIPSAFLLTFVLPFGSALAELKCNGIAQSFALSPTHDRVKMPKAVFLVSNYGPGDIAIHSDSLGSFDGVVAPAIGRNPLGFDGKNSDFFVVLVKPNENARFKVCR